MSMSKRSAKRKQVSDFDSHDESSEVTESVEQSTTPSTIDLDASVDDIATAFLQYLPPNATLNCDKAKKMLQAFEIAKKELQNRTTALANHVQIMGSHQLILVCNGQVSLSEDACCHILDFLPKREIVHKVSFISKAWLSMSRSPRLWKALNTESGTLDRRSQRISNMEVMLQLLKRPQFKSLRILVPPDKIRMRKRSVETIAQACPLLEHFDIGYSEWSAMHPDDMDLVKMPILFPNLCSIHMRSYNISRSGLDRFVQQMGSRLVELKTVMFVSRLSDTSIDAIRLNCPNLETLRYELGSRYYNEDKEVLSQEIMGLIQDCPKLKNLVLINTKEIKLEAFEHIASLNNKSKSLQRLLVSGHVNLMRSPHLCARLQTAIPQFEVVSEKDKNRRIKAAQLGEENGWY
jgi:hypothetical protein